MEKWKVVCQGLIPQDTYQVCLTNGEEKGLIVELSSEKYQIKIDFGIVRAVRILDEGIVQTDLYSDKEIAKFKNEHFRDVIYEIENGEFKQKIKKIADGFLDVNVKHYIIITQNYNIEVITEFIPEIIVS